MQAPTSQNVAEYLANSMSFQQWLSQYGNQNVGSLQNDPSLNAIREDYNKSLSLSKGHSDSPQNINVDINTFMQGVEMAKNMMKTAQMVNKVMDHNAYPESLKTKSTQQLYYIMKDCQEALKANPDNPNAGYYQDEINYCANELHRRQNPMKTKAQAIEKVKGFEIHPHRYQGGGIGYAIYYPPYGPTNSFGPFGFQKSEDAKNWLIRFINEHPNSPHVLEAQEREISEHETANTEPHELINSGGDLSDIERDHGTPAQYAKKKLAQTQPNNMEQLITAINQSLGKSQALLVEMVNILKQNFQLGGGQSPDTNLPQGGESGQVENLNQEITRDILPHIQKATENFRALSNYFSSFSGVQQTTSPATAYAMKTSIATKYTTGVKSLQEATKIADEICNFTNDFPYFVMNYDGFKVLCNFRTACNNLKKDIENLQNN